MKALRVALTILGSLLILIGAVWVGQGSGLFPYPASSFMINQSPWIMRGLLTALGGGLLLVLGRRIVR